MPRENNQFWKGEESAYVSWEKMNRGGASFSGGAGKKRVLNLFFIVDVSGSMAGSRIEQVNRAMGNVFEKLRQQNDLRCDIRVNVMTFSYTAKWLTRQPVPLAEYRFSRIEADPWYTCYSKAFLALEEKLHSAAFMNPGAGEYLSPLILFISDGEPEDAEDYPAALDALKRNRWFRRASKYAVAVGEESRDRAVIRTLAQFTDLIENVRYADGRDDIARLVEHIALQASKAQVDAFSSGQEDVTGARSIFRKRDETLFDTMFDRKK